jgi:hypothetical protein
MFSTIEELSGNQLSAKKENIDKSPYQSMVFPEPAAKSRSAVLV